MIDRPDAPEPLPFGGSHNLEWEVTHTKSRLHKGRGSTPEAALRDLHESLALGVKDAEENLERETKRLNKLAELLDDTGESPPGEERIS